MELGPKVWDAWMHYSAFYLMPMRRLDEAVVVLRKALELDPLSPSCQYVLGLAYCMDRQYDRAIEQFRNALDLNPHWGPAHIALGNILILIGKSDEGIGAIETGVQLFGRSPLNLTWLGFAYANVGRIGDAQKLLAELQALAQKAYMSPFIFVPIYFGLGEMDKCFDWMEKAVEERDSLIFMLPVNPIYDPLRSHPRSQALLRKMNLEP
jgi:tetratricopeptide (TPR) repeat protein